MNSIKKRDYDADLDRLKTFLESYHNNDPDTGKKVFKYGDMVLFYLCHSGTGP